MDDVFVEECEVLVFQFINRKLVIVRGIDLLDCGCMNMAVAVQKCTVSVSDEFYFCTSTTTICL